MPSYYYTKFQKNPCVGRNERCPLPGIILTLTFVQTYARTQTELYYFRQLDNYYVPTLVGVCVCVGGGGGGVHIIFSADSVSVGVDVASCLHSISLMKEWILAKLTQIYHWVGEKC